MKNLNHALTILVVLFYSHSNFAQGNAMRKEVIEKKAYNLYKPDTPKATLILFGGFPETAESIEKEFPITDLALQKDVAVAYLNFNRKILLDSTEKTQLAHSIREMLQTNNLPSDNIYIGGISSGGNIALLISNYLIKHSNSNLNVAGVFAIDSPVDLAALYRITEETLNKIFQRLQSVKVLSFITTFRLN